MIFKDLPAHKKEVGEKDMLEVNTINHGEDIKDTEVRARRIGILKELGQERREECIDTDLEQYRIHDVNQWKARSILQKIFDKCKRLTRDNPQV